MAIALVVLALLALSVGPGLWVQNVMRRYSQPPDRYARTGGQTARRLLDALRLGNVIVEITEKGDHYDPLAKVVRLTADNFNGRSLTAVTIVGATLDAGASVATARRSAIR